MAKIVWDAGHNSAPGKRTPDREYEHDKVVRASMAFFLWVRKRTAIACRW